MDLSEAGLGVIEDDVAHVDVGAPADDHFVETVAIDVAGRNRGSEIVRAPAGTPFVDPGEAGDGVVEDLVTHVDVGLTADDDFVQAVSIHVAGCDGGGVVARSPARAAAVQQGEAVFGVIEDLVAHVDVGAPADDVLLQAVAIDVARRDGGGVVARAPAVTAFVDLGEAGGGVIENLVPHVDVGAPADDDVVESARVGRAGEIPQP